MNVKSISRSATVASITALRSHMPTKFDASLQPQPSSPYVPCEMFEQWKQFQGMTSKLMRMLWSTDADGALRKLLPLPAEMAQPAFASLGGFLSQTKRAEDEALLVHILQQAQSGAWSPLGGRTDMLM